MQRQGSMLPCKSVLAAVVCLVLLAGCNRDQQAALPQMTPQVSTVTVEPRPIVLSTELSGRTSAYRVAEIRPRVNGLVEKRLFIEGSNVREDQVLYQIDPAPFQAELDNAKAALAEAEAKLPTTKMRADRYKNLVTHSALSQQDYDDAASNYEQVQASVNSLKARVETARINLGYTKVTAPISGRIGKSSVTDGAIVTAYQSAALATIQQLDPIYVDVPQATAEMLRMKDRLREGLLNHQDKDHNKVRLVMEDGKPYPLEGTFQFSDVTVDPTTGSVTLRLIFPNPEGEILPGMFVKAIIKEGVNPKAILIPQQGVSRDPKGNPYALLVDKDSKAVLRPLTLDRAIGNEWLVTKGLNPGDRVIVEGAAMLRPGTTVKATALAPAKPEGAQEANAAVAAAKPGAGEK